MKKITQKQQEQIEALASIADVVSSKDVIDKKEIDDVNQRLDVILASVDEQNKFFKRLL